MVEKFDRKRPNVSVGITYGEMLDQTTGQQYTPPKDAFITDCSDPATVAHARASQHGARKFEVPEKDFRDPKFDGDIHPQFDR